MSSRKKAFSTSILWNGILFHSKEWCQLRDGGNRKVIEGVVILSLDSKPCLLEYTIETDRSWQTRKAAVSGYMGRKAVSLVLKVDARHRWQLNGDRLPSVDGCIDVDLGFSPSTNLLPIRRLGLEIGASAEVAAAWVEFPSMKVKVLRQKYSRSERDTYHYESGGGRFTRDLLVNQGGLVTTYPGLWEMDAVV